MAVQGGDGQSIHVDGMLHELKFDSNERPKLVHRLDKVTIPLINHTHSNRES
jgi:23S rRNA pseudouridine955/2504/2580 synthase